MNSHSWKMVVGSVLSYQGFTVRLLEISDDKEYVTKMEALGTDFFSQEQIFKLAALGFVKGLDGNYIYEVKQS